MPVERSHKARTICEVFREVNDLFQDDSEVEEAIRTLLMESEHASKVLSITLRRHSRRFDKGWWDKNKDYDKDLTRRHKEYKCGCPTREMRRRRRSIKEMFSLLVEAMKGVVGEKVEKAIALLEEAKKMEERMTKKLNQYEERKNGSQ